MNVGILTTWYWNNYGTVLQAYALQTYLKNEEHIVKFIRYVPGGLNFHEMLTALKKSGRKDGVANTFTKALSFISNYLDNTLKISISAKHSSKINQYISSFRSNYLNIDDKLYSSGKELYDYPPEYDVYIAGSDNIWLGVNDNGWDEREYYPYYLDFVSSERRKLSYAASMGNPIIPKHHEKRITLLFNNLDYVSVRGKSTASLLRNQLHCDAIDVLDPTLLLTANDWEAAFPIIREGSSVPYVLVYVIYPISLDAPVFQYSNLVAEKLGLKIKYIGFHPNNKKPSYTEASVDEYLQLFRHATLVITDSFHGMLFSIIFRKNFYVFPPRHSETRITDMLASIDLSSRYVHTVKEAESLPIEIDYMIPEQKLNELREFSMTWLDNAINSEKSTEAAS